MVGKTKIRAIESCAFTNDKSKVQRLDTDRANMTAESLNFWLIKFAEELCKENGERLIYCVRLVETTLNRHPPFVVSVAC